MSSLDIITNSGQFTKRLFDAEAGRLEKLLQTVIDKNCWLTGTNNSTGIIYKGQKYFNKVGVSTPLDESLEPMMEDYCLQHASLIREATAVNQLVLMLTSNCTSVQDIRDALPECLIIQCKDLPTYGLARTRPATWNLTNKQKVIYEKVLPTVEYFAATHLLF